MAIQVVGINQHKSYFDARVSIANNTDMHIDNAFITCSFYGPAMADIGMGKAWVRNFQPGDVEMERISVAYAGEITGTKCWLAEYN